MLPLEIYGSKILRTPCLPVLEGTDLKPLIQEMFQILQHVKGVGLAAPQVGSLHRLIVLDNGKALINPEITERHGRQRVKEGCLSIPGTGEWPIWRDDTIKLRFFDADWKLQEHGVSGFSAAVVQHEIDHLNGILFIDHLSSLKRDMAMRRFYKWKKGNLETPQKVAQPSQAVNQFTGLPITLGNEIELPAVGPYMGLNRERQP